MKTFKQFYEAKKSANDWLEFLKEINNEDTSKFGKVIKPHLREVLIIPANARGSNHVGYVYRSIQEIYENGGTIAHSVLIKGMSGLIAKTMVKYLKTLNVVESYRDGRKIYYKFSDYFSNKLKLKKQALPIKALFDIFEKVFYNGSEFGTHAYSRGVEIKGNKLLVKYTTRQPSLRERDDNGSPTDTYDESLIKSEKEFMSWIKHMEDKYDTKVSTEYVL